MSESELPPIDSSDVGVATVLVIEEILRQLFRANLIERETLALAIEARKAEFVDGDEDSLRRMLSIYADSVVRRGAK